MTFNPAFAKFGEILLHENIISEEQLKEALNKQDNFGLKIGETLKKLKYITDDDIMQTLKKQYGYDIVKEEDLLDLDTEVVKMIPEPFAVENRVIAIDEDQNSVVVAMTDPENIEIIDSVKKIIDKPITPVLISDEILTDTLERYYKGIRTDSQVKDAVGDLDFVAVDEDENEITIDAKKEADAPAVKLINLIFTEAIKSQATDIHIEPLSKETRVRFRIDGALREIMTSPSGLHSGLISLIKVMAKLNIAERRLPQDGHISLKTSIKRVDIRVSIIPSINGEKAVLRLLDKGEFGFTLETLGFDEKHLNSFRKLIRRPYGIIIVSGPTGSGKSTTLHAALKRIKNIESNIVTVENPVEYRLNGITQIETKQKIGLTFSNALRSVLRQDPDIVLIGEIRDQETADIAIKFSLTGHLVFTTLHANDAPSTITRLIDIGVPPYLVGSSLNLVMSERLVRKICKHCKTDYQPTQTELEDAGINNEQAEEITFKKGSGCVHCDNTGYQGRTGIFEMLEISPEIRKSIFEEKNQEIIKDLAIKQGMRTLHESALHKMKKGVTTINEVIKLTYTE